MAHDLWPIIRSNLAKSLQFGGHTDRPQFWAWIGILNILVGLAQVAIYRANLSELVKWTELGEALGQIEMVKFAMERMSESWPWPLAVTGFPFGFFGFKTVMIPSIMPLMLLAHLLALAPVSRRARDAGYSPAKVIILLYFSVIVPVAIAAINLVAAAILGIGAMPFVLILSGYLGYAHPLVSLLAALAAVLILAAPSKHSPKYSEVTP